MQVVLKPYEKITVRSYLKHESPEALVDAITLSLVRGQGGRIGGLLWAHGILFRHYPYANSEALAKEYLKAHLPIDHVEFAHMPEFRGEIRTGEFVLTVLDVSNHLTLATLAKWIANNLVNKKPRKRK
jgi:hypothetical protein